MTLLVPRSVADERAAIDAAMREQVYEEYCNHWTHEIKRIDPTLEIVRAKEHVTEPDLEPGRWYILKHIPESVDAYIELPRPPGGWLWDWLTANDMWNPRVHRSKREAADKLREAKVRARKLEHEQTVDAMAEAHRAAKRVRSDAGMHKRTDKKRRGEGLKSTTKNS